MAAEGRSFGEALDSSSRSDPAGPKSAASPSGTNEAAAALLVFFGNDLQAVRDYIHQSGTQLKANFAEQMQQLGFRTLVGYMPADGGGEPAGEAMFLPRVTVTSSGARV